MVARPGQERRLEQDEEKNSKNLALNWMGKIGEKCGAEDCMFL
jgi:hypothetical protein